MGLYRLDVMIFVKIAFIYLTLWQDDVGQLENSKSHLLENVVKSYNNSKYLSTPNTNQFKMTSICELNPGLLMAIIASAEVLGVETLAIKNFASNARDR